MKQRGRKWESSSEYTHLSIPCIAYQTHIHIIILYMFCAANNRTKIHRGLYKKEHKLKKRGTMNQEQNKSSLQTNEYYTFDLLLHSTRKEKKAVAVNVDFSASLCWYQSDWILVAVSACCWRCSWHMLQKRAHSAVHSFALLRIRFGGIRLSVFSLFLTTDFYSIWNRKIFLNFFLENQEIILVSFFNWFFFFLKWKRK